MTFSPTVALVALGLGSGLLGAATATDLISLRAVAHALDVPLLSAAVIGLRESMPTSLAHAIEPATGVVGALLAAGAVVRPGRLRTAALAHGQAAVARGRLLGRRPAVAVQAGLAFGMLRLS